MRISDWSSDVCSSDLAAEAGPKHRLVEHEARSSQCLQPALGFGGKGRRRGVRRAGDPEDAVFRVRMILPAPGLGEAVHHAGGDGRVADLVDQDEAAEHRSEEHTSELQTLMRNSYAVFCLKKKLTTEHRSGT